jgi:hypothetical protein
VYRASDVPASGMLLLSRTPEGETTILSGINRNQHDIDSVARTYFLEVGRSDCLILDIQEKGPDKWEVKYSCQLR